MWYIIREVLCVYKYHLLLTESWLMWLIPHSPFDWLVTPIAIVYCVTSMGLVYSIYSTYLFDCHSVVLPLLLFLLFWLLLTRYYYIDSVTHDTIIYVGILTIVDLLLLLLLIHLLILILTYSPAGDRLIIEHYISLTYSPMTCCSMPMQPLLTSTWPDEYIYYLTRCYYLHWHSHDILFICYFILVIDVIILIEVVLFPMKQFYCVLLLLFYCSDYRYWLVLLTVFILLRYCWRRLRYLFYCCWYSTFMILTATICYYRLYCDIVIDCWYDIVLFIVILLLIIRIIDVFWCWCRWPLLFGGDQWRYDDDGNYMMLLFIYLLHCPLLTYCCYCEWWRYDTIGDITYVTWLLPIGGSRWFYYLTIVVLVFPMPSSHSDLVDWWYLIHCSDVVIWPSDLTDCPICYSIIVEVVHLFLRYCSPAIPPIPILLLTPLLLMTLMTYIADYDWVYWYLPIHSWPPYPHWPNIVVIAIPRLVYCGITIPVIVDYTNWPLQLFWFIVIHCGIDDIDDVVPGDILFILLTDDTVVFWEVLFHFDTVHCIHWYLMTIIIAVIIVIIDYWYCIVIFWWLTLMIHYLFCWRIAIVDDYSTPLVLLMMTLFVIVTIVFIIYCGDVDIDDYRAHSLTNCCWWLLILLLLCYSRLFIQYYCYYDNDRRHSYLYLIVDTIDSTLLLLFYLVFEDIQALLLWHWLPIVGIILLLVDWYRGTVLLWLFSTLFDCYCYYSHYHSWLFTLFWYSMMMTFYSVLIVDYSYYCWYAI